MSAAESAVARAGDAVVDMEYFGARDSPPADACREVVRTCDVFVLLAGFRYGSLVAGDALRSHTELEHDTAAQARIPRLVFLLHERTLGPAEMFRDTTHGGRQDAFRERLLATEGVVTAMVTSPADVEIALFQALMTLPRPDSGPRPVSRLDTIPAGRIAFVGREQVLDTMATCLSGGGHVVAVTGMSGAGKTSTVIEYAHRHRAEFDITWWIRANDAEMVPTALADLAWALDLATRRESDAVAVARLRGFLQEHERWLLVFDDVADGRTLAAYLPRGPGQILITSRDPVWRGKADSTVEIPLFDRHESVAVLRTWTSTITESDADRVADALGDLPQVLDQAGSLLTVGGLSVAEYLELLEVRATEAYEHDAGGMSPPAATTWSLAFDQLERDEPAAMELLVFLAWCGSGPVPRTLLQVDASRSSGLPTRLRAVATDPRAPKQAIEILRRRGMVVSSRDTVLLHRVPAGLLQARTTVATNGEPWSAVVVRLLSAALPHDVWDNPERWDVWRQSLPHVRAATDRGRDIDSAHEDVAWLLDRMATYLQTTGTPREALPQFRRALSISRAMLGDDHRRTLFYANNLANNLREIGLHDEAFLLNRETLTRRTRVLGIDDEDTLKSAKNLALNLFDLGEFEKALAMDADTLDRRRRVLEPDHEDTLNSARNLANNLRELGRHDEARAQHEETLERLRGKFDADHPRTLQCAGDLADDWFALGAYDRALDLHEETLLRRRRVLGETHPHTLASSHRLAVVLAAVGEAARARALIENVLAGRRRVLGHDHPDTVAAERSLAAIVDTSARQQAPRREDHR